MTTKQLGAQGEYLVHELLPGSEHINKSYETYFPYDIVWNGIKIDVKTVTATHDNYVTVALRPREIHAGTIVVIVCLERKSFWVFPYSDKMKNYYRFDHSITADKVAASILQAVEDAPTIIVATNKSKPVSLSAETHSLVKVVSEMMKSKFGLSTAKSTNEIVYFVLQEYIKSNNTN